jgi:hypothetical protein
MSIINIKIMWELIDESFVVLSEILF